MSLQSSVTVIIVNWRSEALLLECLQRLQRQTRVPDRVLVFDNSACEDPLCLDRGAFDAVELVPSESNIGFARANNLCAARCAGCEWICLLNPDAYAEPGWLEALLRAAERYPDHDCFASLILQENDRRVIDSAGDVYRRSGIALHRFCGCRVEQMKEEIAKPCDVFAPCAAAAMYRRSVFLASGGFDESLFAFYEDVDLGLRLRLAGHRTLFVPDAVVHHLGGGATGGLGSPTAAYYGQRNFILAFFKNMPASLLWAALPAHLWAVMRGIGKGCLEGRAFLLLKATVDALVRLPECLRSRRRVQAQRRVGVAEFRSGLSAGCLSAAEGRASSGALPSAAGDGRPPGAAA